MASLSKTPTSQVKRVAVVIACMGDAVNPIHAFCMLYSR